MVKCNIFFMLFFMGCIEYSENTQRYKLLQVKGEWSRHKSLELDSIEIIKNKKSYYASQVHSCYEGSGCSVVLGEPDADIFLESGNAYSIANYGFVVVSFQDENGDELYIESGDIIKAYFLNEFVHMDFRSISIRAVDVHGNVETLCTYQSPEICWATNEPEIDYRPERVEICSKTSPVVCQVP